MKGWKLLRNVVRKRDGEKSEMDSFGFESAFIQYIDWKNVDGDIIEYTIDGKERIYMKEENKSCCVEDLAITSVDNTGNIRTWPCERILAGYMIKCLKGETKKVVMEIGAGRSGLIGILANKMLNMEVVITDGNERGVRVVRENIQRNALKSIRGETLVWNRKDDYKSWEKVDVVFGADCLFFKEYHVDLLHTLETLLDKNTGKAYLLQPSRGGCMESFVALVRSTNSPLNVQVVLDFDMNITKLHHMYSNTYPSYRADLHRPILVILSYNG